MDSQEVAERKARMFHVGQTVWVKGTGRGTVEWPERVVRVMRSGNVHVTVNGLTSIERSIPSQMCRPREAAARSVPVVAGGGHV